MCTILKKDLIYEVKNYKLFLFILSELPVREGKHPPPPQIPKTTHLLLFSSGIIHNLRFLGVKLGAVRGICLEDFLKVKCDVLSTELSTSCSKVPGTHRWLCAGSVSVVTD